MKLYTFYNERFLPLKKIFSKSLKDDFEVEYVLFDSQVAKAEAGGGLNVWIYKTKYIIKVIEENYGEKIVFSDIDIQFFKKTESIIQDSLDEFDMVFQGSKNFLRANIGFMAINCNETTLNFWNDVLKRVEEEKVWDEDIVNSLLSSDENLNWGLFPNCIWNLSLSRTWKSIALHHAMGTSDLKVKVFQMRIVKFVYYFKWINNFELTYKISRKIYREYRNYRHKKYKLI